MNRNLVGFGMKYGTEREKYRVSGKVYMAGKGELYGREENMERQKHEETKTRGDKNMRRQNHEGSKI